MADRVRRIHLPILALVTCMGREREGRERERERERGEKNLLIVISPAVQLFCDEERGEEMPVSVWEYNYVYTCTLYIYHVHVLVGVQ